MKRVIWILVLTFVLACSPTVFAQNQKVRYEKKEKTIYLDEKPHAKLYQVGGIMSADFSLKTLAEKEIVYFKYDTDKGFYEVVFMETGEKAYLENGALGGKGLSKFVVENQFVKDDALNQEAKKRYITLNSTPPTGGTNIAQKIGIGIGNNNNNSTPNTPNVQYAIVERDKKDNITTNMSNEIKQDFKVIGTFEKNDNFSAGTITYYIKLPNGTTIAEAVGQGIAPNKYEVTAYANRSRSIITVKYTTSPVEDIAKYLVDNGYL